MSNPQRVQRTERSSDQVLTNDLEGLSLEREQQTSCEGLPDASSESISSSDIINEQTVRFNQILSSSDIDDSRLILDFDTKTSETRVEVDPVLMKDLKPHQREGIKFMYNSTIESVDKLREPGSGCILAHHPGLGKTLQVITFVHTILSNPFTKNQIKTILIVVPDHSFKVWVDEFDKRIKQRGLKTFIIREMVERIRDKNKLQIFQKWKQRGGVLIIGRKLFVKISLFNVSGGTWHTGSKVNLLLHPQPDMLILDEGHLIGSCSTSKHAYIFAIVFGIRTRRKILLTSKPLQSNLDKYSVMINFIKPQLLDSIEFENRFKKPIENGQKSDSTAADIELMKLRLYELNGLLSSCVHQAGIEILKFYLKPKFEYVLFIRPSKLIAKMYNYFLNHHAQFSCDKAIHAEIEHHENTIENDGHGERKVVSDWLEKCIQPDDWQDIELSGKFVLLFKILDGCISVGDKLVVVSQSLRTLGLIERCLKLYKNIQNNGEEVQLKWKPNFNYFRIFSKGKLEEKHEQINKFNDPQNVNARLLLLSTGNCEIDINLIGANRCIIFDASWNPTADNQVIHYFYRMGQLKSVYVYRFVSKRPPLISRAEDWKDVLVSADNFMNILYNTLLETQERTTKSSEFAKVYFLLPTDTWLPPDLKDFICVVNNFKEDQIGLVESSKLADGQIKVTVEMKFNYRYHLLKKTGLHIHYDSYSMPMFDDVTINEGYLEEKIFHEQIVERGMDIRLLDKQKIETLSRDHEDIEMSGTKSDYVLPSQDPLLAEIFTGNNWEILDYMELDSSSKSLSKFRVNN